MAAAHGELQEEKAKNLSSSQSYQRVADRVQQWNRAIPEAGYVTLGTIRYGVRLSTGSHQLGGFSGSSTSSSQIIQTVQRAEGFSPNSTTTTSRSGSSDRSIESGNFNSCCCIGPSGIVLPWTNNYARTKLPVSSATAKNRTLSTSKSSSFSLRAMSAPDPPPAVRGPQPPSSEHLRPGESISSVIVLNPSQSTSTSKGDSKGVHHETHIEMSTLASTVPYLPRFTSSQAIAESAKSVSSVATITPSTMPAPTTEPTTASNTTLCQSCCSVSCAAVSCCKLNSASVLFDQCRELSVSPTPKSLPSSICCYTIANNSKAISKPSNRLNPKRIPRAVVQQTITSVRSCQTNQIPGAPPPVPPKPTNSESNEDHSVDPVHFRRKIQKFELQTAIDNEKNNRFEFFGCFSATPVNLDRSDCVSSTISEVSSNQGNDYQAILRSNKSHVSDTACGSVNQSDHRNGYPAKRTLRYNNAGKPVPQPIDPCTINIRSFGEPSTATVVIRKLTPKLSKKSFQFGDQHLRSESEDRLIDRGDSDQPTPTSVDSIANSDANEDDSDIGFIDSSGDGDRLSSLSDLDVRNFSTKTVTPFNKNNSCNLSFDSVPKIINNCNEGYVRSLSARDLYNSLSDIESSTLSCLSEDSICCACNDSCQHIKSDQNIATSSDCCCLCCCSDRGANCEIISGTKHYCCKCQKRGKRSLCESVKHLSPSPPPPPLPSHPPPSLNPLQQLSLGSVKGPVLKRVPAIESFGYISKSQQLTRGSSEKGCMMEKRRNTLDRLQRLGFGRKSSPSPTPENKSSGRKSSDKSERLKELTELLKGNRSSPTPPPIPPPRKLKHSNSVEKPPDPEPGPFTAADSDDIIPMDEEEEHIPEPVNRKSDEISLRSDGSVSAPPTNTQKHSLYQFLKPNSSISNLETIGREKSKSPPLISPKDEELFTKLAKAESRSIVPQKTIPFRSASFSQIDYSSGKYIKSALGAIRDRLRRDKEPSVVESANLTLPRKKDSSKGFLKRSNSIEKDSRICPVKKTELSISLKFEPDNEKVSLEEIVNPPDVIFEEENYPADSEKCFEQQERDIEEELDVPGEVPIMLDESIAEPIKVIDSKMPTSNTMPNLATLAEEDIPLESPPENFLQTATTCLIPVPVYECVAREWNAENPPEQWVDVAPNEIGINSEIVEPVQEVLSPTNNKNDGGSSPEETTDMSNFAAEQQLPTISVSEDSIQTPDSLPFESDLEGAPTSPMHTLNRNIGSLSSEPSFEDKSTDDKSEEKPFEFIEVKKRYSNDEPKIGDRSLSLDQTVFRGSEEKRRIDKSRRRKGMYIQWPTIDRHVGIDSTDWSPNPESIGSENLGEKGSDLDLTKVDFSTIKSPEDHSPLYFTCRTPEDNRTPGSQYSFDPSTPESDCSRPNWPRVNRRTSLSCQSSEEKDESLTASPGQRAHRNILYLRSDSISDNESDRTPPSLRDRTSPSPAPGDQDFKRYSKRPLRGPYGQMLEAEMKKPGKHHYDEILEELKDPKSLNTLSVHHRGQGNLSFDETQLSQQQSKLNRGRKSNNSLPVPAHTRAASTPSQMENTTTTASMGTISPSEKRYQSSMDMDSSNSSKSKGKEPKKFSLDSNRDKSPKRASSEATPMDNSKQHPKRSASTASEKHQKRSLDEVRLSQVSRTPSERSMVSESGKGGGILPTPELLAELLKGSSERLISEQRQQMFMDTRTYVVQEIFRNEQSYVESLQTVVKKYLNVLKTPEYAGMIDSKTVDEIFFMVPDILSIHEKFLSELKARLDSWDPQQKVGDSFIETFSRTEVLETYTAFVNNCNRAKDAIKMTCQSRPSFARFLEAMSREHKGKLPLDNLLIKPVQKFPNYEMLFTRLIKHTDIDHPDQKPLQEVLKLVHDILVHINCKEKEVLENGQREATLRELEGVIEGITDLVAPQRQFLIFDLVSMPSGQGARKERGFFLFSDLLVITSIKRRSGTIRKPNTTTCPGSVASTLDTNKYKFLTKVSLDHLEIVKTKDENLRRIMNEIEQLADDCNKLQQIAEVTATLRYPHQTLEETIRDLHREVQRQLSERQSNDAQLNLLELTVSSPGGNQNLSIVFSKAEKRSQWEEAFNEAKQKLAASLERHPIPEFLMSIPIRKTRAGLQFTCAAPTLSNQKDVWVCNSDGYVGQVCVLSLIPDPTVTSCNGVCNARILCVASVPAYSETKKPNSSSSNDETPRNSRISNLSHCQIASNSNDKKKTNTKAESGSDIQLDSNSSSEESEVEGGTHPERMPSPAPSMTGHHQHQDSNSDETDNQQSTMWLGTEDGCIHVYNCTDNIRIKKNKIKIQHVSAVYSILYLDNRVFVALANGDICVYLRDSAGWNTASPLCISIGTVSSPVSRLLNVHGKLWCSIQGIIKVLDTKTLQVENQIQISSDSKPITNMAVSSNFVWISIQNSAHIKCFHSNSHELILEVNLAPSVNKMLSNCDDIIRQHKAACLRVTSLLACRDLIWIGTSAGVLLTLPAQGYTKGQTSNMPVVTGIPHGHTGHVRFLTCVDTGLNSSSGTNDDKISENKTNRHSMHNKTKPENGNILIISGGDGYEDFRSSGVNTMSEVAGREDSTNHLLLWQM